MKHFLLFSMIILASAQVGRSQCAPNNPTGNIGFFPATDLLPCVERGVYYDETFYLENVDSFVFQGFGTIRVDTFRIDSIVNVPCNLNWISDRGDNTYLTGQTGCIRIFGVSNDSVGQYELKVYVTIVATILGTLQGDINEIIENLEDLTGPLGVDFEYFIRVKEPLDPCPNIDRSTNSPLARNAQASCAAPGALSARITGDTTLCRGIPGQLSLQLSNATNPAVEWLPASAVTSPTSASTDITLNNSAYVTVAVTDTANTGNTYFDRVWIQLDTADPVASFVDTINGRSIKLQSTSINGTSYSWNLGDQSSANGTLVLHTYAADGIYPISLTATNSCGTDTYYDTLYIGNVGIEAPSTQAVQSTLYPNPAHGTVTLKVGGLKPLESYSIHIMDAAGKEALAPTTLQYQPNAPVTLAIASLQPGVYVFQIKALHSSTFHKLIIY